VRLEPSADFTAARQREAQLKKWSGQKKEALVRGNLVLLKQPQPFRATDRLGQLAIQKPTKPRICFFARSTAPRFKMARRGTAITSRVCFGNGLSGTQASATANLVAIHTRSG